MADLIADSLDPGGTPTISTTLIGRRGSDVNFTFRSRGQMRERLQAAASASGRSISEEIEYRLDQSFTRDPLAGQLIEYMGGEENFRVLRLIREAQAILDLEKLQELVRTHGTFEKVTSRECAEAFRVATDLIIASWAGLPEEPAIKSASEQVTRAARNQFVPEMQGRHVAKLVLERAGLPWPAIDVQEQKDETS